MHSSAFRGIGGTVAANAHAYDGHPSVTIDLDSPDGSVELTPAQALSLGTTLIALSRQCAPEIHSAA